jgi:hypothetical protein
MALMSAESRSMINGRNLLLVSSLFVGVLSAQAVPVVDTRAHKALVSTARRLAKAGLARDCNEVLDALAGLGCADAKLDDLRATCDKSLARVRKPKSSLPSAVRQLQRVAKQLAATLDEQQPDAQLALARLLVRIDGDCEAARAVLGYRRVGDAWQTETDEHLTKRRSELQEAMREARRMPVELQVAPSDEPLLAATFEGARSVARFGSLEIHSSWSEPRLRRILTETLRAVALSNWLTGGKLELPKRFYPHKWIVVHSIVDYERAVDEAVATRRLVDDIKDAKEQSSAFLRDDWILDWNRTEADTQASLISRLVRDLSTPCLSAGHKNWICQAIFGPSLPGHIWTETTEGGKGPRGTAATREQTAKR